jgi:predicted Kef-type K+ transport protein
MGMSPVVKYSLARVGLFAAVFAALLPVSLDIFVKLLIALVASAGFSFILLRGLRDQVADQMASSAERRKAEKDRLRAALAGDDEQKKNES